MSRYQKADLSQVKLVSIENRLSKVSSEEWGSPFEPGDEFTSFIDSLPDILAAHDLRRIAENWTKAIRLGKPVILMMGGHVVKVGLGPLIYDLLEHRLINGVAMNSAAAIHDVESVLFGETSEDVAAAITDGSFGMSKETGEFINQAVSEGYASDDSDLGFGEALGNKLLTSSQGKERCSIIEACVRIGTPITVHVAIGADIVHQQPSMSGEATGELSFRDFRLLSQELQDLGSGGVVLNFGSAVILPEVFLKALTVARNLGADAFDFTTANFDMIRHYRPRVNVVARPTQDGGEGFDIAGHHEIMFPLLAAMVKARMRRMIVDSRT
ncbi:MAG: hypothetical protein J4G05_05415 [Chlorobi bacterium]|nr:hypothetical protein [Chlorobiota bacterium]